MARSAFEVLRSINEQLLGRRWTDEDLHQLFTARFGVVSSFESVSRDLTEILQQDLGDTPPAVASGETGT